MIIHNNIAIGLKCYKCYDEENVNRQEDEIDLCLFHKMRYEKCKPHPTESWSAVDIINNEATVIQSACVVESHSEYSKNTTIY